MTKFILASGSPRRKELLSRMGVDFDVLVSDVDEEKVAKDIPVRLYVQELALLKAGASMKNAPKDAIIIAADTVVTLFGKVLGKPRDEDDARRMLLSLSAREHEVYTGVCVMRGRDGKTTCESVCTKVKFKPLTEDKINAYISTGEPMDKAGAYGIQGKGSMLIEGIEGDYFNVVGLPIARLTDILEKEFEIELL